MKKLFLLICLFAIALAGVACGGNGDGGDDGSLTVQQIFSKFETVQINMENYEGSLSIVTNHQNFSGQNKEQMNTDGYWCEGSTEYVGYDKDTGAYYEYSDRYAWIDVYKVNKIFSDGKIGYYEYGNTDGVLVDSKYGLYEVKKGRFEDREYSNYYGYLLSQDVNFLSYKECIDSFESYKTTQLEYYDSIDYTISAKQEGGLYFIEATIARYKDADEYNGSADEEITFKYTFNDTMFLKYEYVSENSGHSFDNTDTWYSYESRVSDIATTFSNEKYESIDKSIYNEPYRKITQELAIYRDGAIFTTYDVEFGTKLSEFIEGIHISQKENTKGYKVYVDEDNTKLLSDEEMSSYKKEKLYYVSIPDDDYATINTRYIYEKSSGERKVEKVISTIEMVTDYTFPDYPAYNKQYEIKNSYDGAKYYFEDVYVNGQKLDTIFTEILSGNTYYIDVIHKQDATPVSVNVYDNYTGKIWKTFTNYENGTLLSHIQHQIVYNQSYYGANLLYLNTSFSTSNGASIDNQSLLKVDGNMDIYMTVRSISTPVSARNNMFRYDDLSTSEEIDEVLISSMQSGEYAIFYMGDYDTFIINGYEFRKNGVLGNIAGYDFHYVYDSAYNRLKVSLGGMTYNIQYKKVDGFTE